MAKQTLEQKISKTEDSILKEEMLIEESREKLKKLRNELKFLKHEKDKEFADELLKIIKEKGIDGSKLINDLKATPEKDDKIVSEDVKKDNVNSEQLSEDATLNSTNHLNQNK